MKQLDNEQMRSFWKRHSRAWKGLDRSRDKLGLSNVCYNGAPLPYNRIIDELQRDTFAKVIAGIPVGKALDVGCGTGRWCALLNSRGWSVTGIDLQPDTIASNRELIPDVTFEVMPADDLQFGENHFDLATSVTVLQHIPYGIQEAIAESLYRVIAKGGHVLIIENTVDKDFHVFSRSLEEWKALFESKGFTTVREAGSLYYPPVALTDKVLKRLFLKRNKKPSGEDYAENKSGDSLLKRLYFWGKYPLLVLSRPFEGWCEKNIDPAKATHAALLFRK